MSTSVGEHGSVVWAKMVNLASLSYCSPMIIACLPACQLANSILTCSEDMSCVTSGSALVVHDGIDLSGAIGLILATWA